MIREPWSDRAHQILRPALRGDDEIIRREVETGEAALWRFEDDRADGYAVARVEQLADERELVIVAGAGRGLEHAVSDLWDWYQQNYGVTRIRAHIVNPAIIRLFQRVKGLNFRQKEIVIEGTPDGRIEQ